MGVWIGDGRGEEGMTKGKIGNLPISHSNVAVEMSRGSRKINGTKRSQSR